MSTTVTSADAKAVVRAVEALTTQVKRIVETLSTPVVRYEVAADDDATTPATTCSAQHHGHASGPRECIRAGQHRGDHIDEQGYHWSNTVAVYPVHDGPEREGPAAVPRCVCGDPIEQTGDPARWIHSPGSGKPALDAHTVRPAIDRCEHRGPHPGFTCAEVDASQPYFRVRWEQEQQAPADDEDGPYLLRVLADRAARGVLSLPGEGEALRRRVEQLISGRATWKAKAEEIERDRDRIAAELAQLRAVLEYEHKRANDAIDRETTAEEAAEEQRQRADIFETELRVLRAGLRANGADPTQIQNLWAQISLRNRQWRETKRELRVTRSMLEEEGGDVSLVDEMISTVAQAEQDAREAQQKLSDSETLGHKVLKRAERAEDTIKQARAAARWIRRNYPGMTQVHDRLTAALDGTEQPTTEQP